MQRPLRSVRYERVHPVFLRDEALSRALSKELLVDGASIKATLP
jgi:hypothetical protein